MEWFEKEYKNRFEHESSLEGVESDPLWNQISKSIPQKKSSYKSMYWKWIMVTIVLISTALVWRALQDKNANSDVALSKSNPSIQPNEKTTDNIKNEEHIVLDNQINIINENIDQLLTETKVDNNDNKESQSTAQLKKSNIRNGSSESSVILNRTDKKNGAKTINNISSSTDLLTTSNKSKVIDQSAEFASQNIPIQTQNSIVGNEVVTQISENNTEVELIENRKTDYPNLSESGTTLNPINSRELIELNMLYLPMFIEYEQNSNINIPSAIPTKITIEKKNPFAFQIQTSANLFNLKYSGDQDSEVLVDDTNASLGSMQLGNGLAINMEYQLNGRWSLQAGLEINNFEYQLNTVLTSDIMVLDTLQKLRNVQKIRTVRHHNKLSTLTIPLSLGYENQFASKWSIGASVGLSYSLVTSQSGRLLDMNHAILDFSNEVNSQFKNYLSFRVNPFLEYKIGDHLSLIFNGGLSIQNHGNSDILKLKQSSKIYNVGLGLIYHPL